MGSLFESGSKTTSSEPWKEQKPYLQAGFGEAANQYMQGAGVLGGVTDRTADMTQDQKNTYSQMSQFGQGLMPGAQTAIGAGSAALGAGQAYGQNAQAMYNANNPQGAGTKFGEQAGGLYGLAGQAAGYGGQVAKNAQSLTQAGSSMLGQGQQSLGNAQSLFAQSGQDATGKIIQNAGQFADNPYMQSQIDGAISDVNRGFNREVAGINSGASATGNMNSTRAGTLEAYALDDAQDRAANISSSMRGAAYDQGLGLASANHQQGIANQMGANGQLMQGMNSGIAAQQAGNGQLANHYQSGLSGMLSANDQQGQLYGQQSGNQQAANSQLGNYYGSGAGVLGAGAQIGTNALGTQLNGTSAQQLQQQAEIDGKVAQSGQGLSLLQQYMQSIGGSYGGTQTTPTSSIFQQLVGGGVAAAGAYAGM